MTFILSAQINTILPEVVMKTENMQNMNHKMSYFR